MMRVFADTGVRYQSVFEACLQAVQGGFPHLSEKHICLPPHQWFDAALARQVLFHLMIEEFDIPKRRVGAELGLCRETISRGLRVVDVRLTDNRFLFSYTTMRNRAADLGA